MPTTHPTTAPTIHVLVHLPAPLLAEGVAAVLGREPDILVQRLLAGPTAATLRPCAADVLVTDHAGGLAALQQLARGGPRVLMLTASQRERDVCMALEAGVHGYLLEDCTADELVLALRKLKRGVHAICEPAAQRLAQSLASEALTARECEVLGLMALGQPNKGIARDLGMAVGTVQAHVKVVLNKLGARSRTEAVSIANQRGLLALARRPHGHDTRLQPAQVQA